MGIGYTYHSGEDASEAVDVPAPGGLADLHVVDERLLLVVVDLQRLEEGLELIFVEEWLEAG